MDSYKSISYLKLLALTFILNGADDGMKYHKRLIDIFSEIYDESCDYQALVKIMIDNDFPDFDKDINNILSEIKKSENAKLKHEKELADAELKKEQEKRKEYEEVMKGNFPAGSTVYRK